MMLFKEKDDAKNENNWKKFAAFVMNRPLKMSLLTLVFLGLLIIPMFKIELEVPDASSLPPKNETRIAFEDFQEHFLPKNISSVPIVITTNDESALTDTALRQAHTFIKQLEKDSLVIKVDSLFSTLQVDDPTVVSQLVQDTDPSLQAVLATLTSEKRQLVQVTLNDSPTSSATKKWVKALELDGKNSEENGFYYNIGGAAKFNQEIFDEIFNKAAYSVGFILLSTFLILMFAFRSIAIPLKAVLMNILSLSASFGIIVYIFQFGNFGISPSPIAIIIPVFAFSIVFGLSMDYEVFLISRIQEIYIATGDNDYATLHGLTSTSKIITSAAAIMIAVTGAFTFTDIVPVKQIGLGIAISILIDATIIRMVLVPSLMKLLGKWNWWMPFSKK